MAETSLRQGFQARYTLNQHSRSQVMTCIGIVVIFFLRPHNLVVLFCLTLNALKALLPITSPCDVDRITLQSRANVRRLQETEAKMRQIATADVTTLVRTVLLLLRLIWLLFSLGLLSWRIE